MSIKNIFKYYPKKEYNFTLQPKETVSAQEIQNKKNNDTIFNSLEENLTYVQAQYNTMINSDIIIRNFSLWAKGKEYKAFLLYIDGMSDSDLINNFVLSPLMIRNRSNTFNTPDKKPKKFIAHKIKKSDMPINKENNNLDELKNYIYNHLIPQNSISEQSEYSKIFSSLNSGNCILFIDTLEIAFDIDVKGFKQRSIDKPQIENVIKGPQEAFVENIRTNTSILRRIINNNNLIIENIEVGEISQTKCALCYMKNITNDDLVAEAKFRLNNLSIDTLISTGQLEQLIQDDGVSGIPQILSTERPDKCAKSLMQGRAVILVNGNPYALIIPAILTDFLSSPEDSNLKPLFANFLRIIRFIALFLTLLLPGIYISITSFHQELLPTELLFSIFASRENVPFPIIVELLLMELSFELIREGGLRTPSAIGATLGIVGALILGEAAVSANIVSPFLIIVVAITGLSSFALPDFSFGFHLRVFRFAFTIIGFISGFLGLGLSVYLYIALLCSLKSFGVSFTETISPNSSNLGVKYFLPPFWKQEYRHGFLSPKKEKAQNKLSMKWKLGKE